jgi:hypothetical protein
MAPWGFDDRIQQPRRYDVKANDIDGFGRKVRVVAFIHDLRAAEVNLVAAQETRDILDINIAQRIGSRGRSSAQILAGGGLSSSFKIRLSMVFV